VALRAASVSAWDILYVWKGIRRMNTGDIYAFFNERFDCWNACQITGSNKRESNLPAVLLLDWTDNRLPVPADFPSLKPFAMTYYSWDGKYIHHYAMSVKPERFTYCGNYEPLLPGEDLNSFGGWPDGSELFRHKLWANIPKRLRDAYKNAKEQKWRLDEKEIPALFEKFSSFDDLSRYSQLHELYFRVFTDGLRDYIKSNHIVNTLMLDGRQPAVLDFRETGLMEIGVGASGVKEIYLNEIASHLILSGSLEPDLRVYDPHCGRFATLQLNAINAGSAVIPGGLEQLNRLFISNIAEIDLARTLGAHKNIKVLRIWGKPGNITNLSAISALKQLRWLTTVDMFGFSGNDFPSPGELPALNAISMAGLPYEAAQTIKKMYKPLAAKGLRLDISKAHKPEWLAENLDNPFRDWDGNGQVSKGCAKKAVNIYKKTRAELLRICQSENASIQDSSLTLCKAYIDMFNKMESKYEFIDTIFREQIIEALDKLVSEVNAATGEKLNVHALVDACDSLRDF
jgi:hypothetical protein